MAKFSVEGLMAKASINDTCAQCHRDIRLQFNRRSHMPLPEGQMSCDDCHNPHGTLTDPLLKTNTVNETCYQCHAEKRGPFLFEHPPVRENCLNCHTPHGSNQATLLVAPDSDFMPAMSCGQLPPGRVADASGDSQRLEPGTPAHGPRMPHLPRQHSRIQCALRPAFPSMKMRWHR